MNILLAAAVLVVSAAVSAQTAVWTKGFATTTCENMITDEAGNTYVTSYYSDVPLEIDGTQIEPENETSSWLSKFSAAGELQWLVNITATDFVVTTDVQLDADGNVVICGVAYGEINFGAMTFGDPADINARGFIAVFDPNGTCVRTGGTNGEAYVAFTEIEPTDAGDYFVSGQAEGEFYFGVELVPSYGGQDAIYGKFDADLDPKWMYSIGDVGDDAATTLTLDTDGNLFIAGYHEGSFLFDATFFFLSYGGTELFLVKAQNDGDLVWVRTLGSSEEEAQYWMSVETDAENNVYLSGNMMLEMYHGGGLTDSYGSVDPFVTAYDADGFFKWFTHGGSVDYDISMGMIKGKDDNLFIFGYFTGTAEIDGLILNAVTGYDGYFAEFGLDGNAQWVWQTNGDAEEYVTIMSVDPWHNVIAAGYSTGNITVGGMDVDTPEGVDFSVWLAKLLTPDSEPETAVEDIVAENTLAIYPNPADTEINFTTTASYSSLRSLEITDLQGRWIRTIDFEAIGQAIPVSDLLPGCYILTPVYANSLRGKAVQFVVVH